jgi:hypothetical protein
MRLVCLSELSIFDTINILIHHSCNLHPLPNIDIQGIYFSEHFATASESTAHSRADIMPRLNATPSNGPSFVSQLRVGRLSFFDSAVELETTMRTFFAGFEITSIRPMTDDMLDDYRTGVRRHHTFVYFTSFDEAIRARNMTDGNFCKAVDKTLTVELAWSEDDNRLYGVDGRQPQEKASLAEYSNLIRDQNSVSGAAGSLDRDSQVQVTNQERDKNTGNIFTGPWPTPAEACGKLDAPRRHSRRRSLSLPGFRAYTEFRSREAERQRLKRQRTKSLGRDSGEAD